MNKNNDKNNNKNNNNNTIFGGWGSKSFMIDRHDTLSDHDFISISGNRNTHINDKIGGSIEKLSQSYPQIYSSIYLLNKDAYIKLKNMS